jgi:hypothetical protein
MSYWEWLGFSLLRGRQAAKDFLFPFFGQHLRTTAGTRKESPLKFQARSLDVGTALRLP